MFGLFKKKIKEDIQNTTYSEPIDYTDPTDLIVFFKNETGIDFSQKKDIIQNKLSFFCQNNDLSSFKQCLEALKYNSSLKQKLINYLTVNETYFFRELRQIEAMVAKAKEKTKPITILCAPCSSGEEPYTIAITLLENGFNFSDFKILGIDINDMAIEKAKEASYAQRSLHKLSPELIDRYFIKDKDSYLLKESIKALVELKSINIFDSNFKELGKFDFIFSRNMMIYFDMPTKLKAKQILQERLKNPHDEIFFGHADMY